MISGETNEHGIRKQILRSVVASVTQRYYFKHFPILTCRKENVSS